MKKISYLIVVLLLNIFVAFPCLAANTKANDAAKKGLYVDEAGLYRFNSFTGAWGPKITSYYVSVADATGAYNGNNDDYYDALVSRLRLVNPKNYSIGVNVKCKVYFNGSYSETHTWDYVSIPSNRAYEFWIDSFYRDALYGEGDSGGYIFRNGEYLYEWYIDNVWLIDREFYVELGKL